MVGAPEYSFFRTMTRTTSGLPKDTGDNLADVKGVSTEGILTGAGQNLGAPGPENLTSPINRNSQFSVALLDPAADAAAAPNRIRNTTDTGTNKTYGTMTIRRKFTNNTGEAVTRLRFRIVEFTTFPSPLGSGLADLRALNSSDEVVSVATVPVFVFGTSVEAPPSQPFGGAWNTSLNVPGINGSQPASPVGKVLFQTPTKGTIVLNAPLENGQPIYVSFRLGVEQTGRFFFFVNIEASTGCSLITTAPCEINANAPKLK